MACRVRLCALCLLLCVLRVVLTEPKKMGVMQTKATVKPFKSAKKAWVAIKDGVVYLYAKEKVRRRGLSPSRPVN